MKRIVTMMMAVAGAMILSAQMPRSQWHAKVGECALDPAALKSTMAQVSSAEKAAFLAEVNGAIAKMPGSAEAKAAKFLAANRAAVASAGKADRAAVLAEVFASVPPESLTIINEAFAASEFARPGTMSDAEYASIVKATMKSISERVANVESGAVRACFAGIMFIRAAGESASAAVTEAVLEALPAEARAKAQESWIPSAMGTSGTPTYDPMLAVAQAGEEPSHEVVHTIAQMQTVDSLLADLQAGKPVFDTPTVRVQGIGANIVGAPGIDVVGAVPRQFVNNPDSIYYKDKHGNGKDGEPVSYWLQGL